MKSKFLFWGAVLFFILGRNSADPRLFYFFAFYCAMLFIGVLFYKREYKPPTPKENDENVEDLPEADSAAG